MAIAILFDMDGVIVDTNPYHKIAIQQFCTKYDRPLDEATLQQKIYGRTNRDWITNLFGTLTEQQLQAYADEKEEFFRTLYEPHIKPVTGLLNFLDLLVANSIPCAIATSAPLENVDFILNKTGLRKYFDTILYDKMVTHGKPNPEIYLKAAAALGFPNNQCIVIEDALSGVTAGRKSGSKVIGITTTHSAAELSEADFVMNDFNELTIPVLTAIKNA